MSGVIPVRPLHAFVRGKGLYLLYLFTHCGPGSSVGIATDYKLDGQGTESRWGRDFPPVQTGPGAHPSSCTMGTGSFPGVKCVRGMPLTTPPPPSSAEVLEE
jgi:hypothetical protein